MKMLMGLALLVIGSAASAQSSTTDCQRDYFGNVHCTTSPSPNSSGGFNYNQYGALNGNVGSGIADAYVRGQLMRQQEELARQQRELYKQQQALIAAQQAALDAAQKTLPAAAK